MGASRLIKVVLADKNIKRVELSERLGYTGENSVYNMLGKDRFTVANLEKWADALGCQICLRDKETGKIYY